MSGPVTAGYLLVSKYFRHYQEQIKRLLARKRALALEADTADLIGNQFDWLGLLKPARDALAAHIALRNNPHGENMDTIGSYTANTINQKLGQKVPISIVPVSSYGVVDELTDTQVDAQWTFNGWVASCGRVMNTILSGTPYVLQPTSINLLAIDPAPANKTFYVYVRSTFGIVTYQCRADSPPESVSVMYIGRITTGAAGIVAMSFSTCLRIDTFRVSQAPIGSAIPATQGNYDVPTKLTAAWNPLP